MKQTSFFHLVMTALLAMAFLHTTDASAKEYMGKITLTVGETLQVEAVPTSGGYDASGHWGKSGAVFTFISQGNYSCTINAWAVGTGTLTYWGVVYRSGSWFTDTYDKYWDVEVKAAPIAVTSISLSNISLSLKAGETKQLSATISPSNATDKSVSWTSGNTSVATVSSSGLVTAKDAGTATITCKANDGSGVKATCTVTVTKTDDVVAEINAANFPDESFRNWLLEQDYGKDGKLMESEISKITRIIVPGSYSSPGSISSLKGIEFFTALTVLNCSYNQLTVLDVSKNTALTRLSCYNNQLTALDVSKDTALTYLDCDGNQLTALDVSKNTALWELYCSSNQLTALDVSKNTALTRLSCSSNQLTALDVSKNTALWELRCGYNQLTALDVSKNTALTDLSCDKNQLTALDVPKNTALTMLSCSDNQLTALDVSNNTALTYLNCWGNHLTALDVSKNTALTRLYCKNNQLIALDMSKNTALTELYCWGNHLTALDVSKNTALTRLCCSSNQLTALDLSKNTALTYLSCGGNQLTVLDVSKNAALTDLWCDNNQLTVLDVSKNTALTILGCSSNQLTVLDVSKNTALTELYCRGNQIKGAAMDELIASLPQNNTSDTHRFCVIDPTSEMEGNVCTKSQAAAVKAEGWFPCYYDSEKKEYVEYEGSDDEEPTLTGDVNGDGEVNGTDLVTLTNMILGKSEKKGAADVNGDGEVNGTDYVTLVNIVLGKK